MVSFDRRSGGDEQVGTRTRSSQSEDFRLKPSTPPGVPPPRTSRTTFEIFSF
jgi:hypothetical protein